MRAGRRTRRGRNVWRTGAATAVVLVAVGLGVGRAPTRAAADGGPDPTLAGTGRLDVDFGPLIADPGNSYVNDVVRDADGRWLVTGEVSNRAGTITMKVVERLLPSGDIDPSFGTGGRIAGLADGSTPNGTRIAVLPGGDIVLAAGTGGPFLLDPNGRYRSVVTFPGLAANFGVIDAVRPLPDGRLLAGGMQFVGGFRVAITNPDPLGVTATQELLLPNELADGAGSMALEGDAAGRIFVTRCPALGPCRVVVFAPDGSLDTSYGTGGVVDLGGLLCDTAVAPDGFLAFTCSTLGAEVVGQYDASGRLDVGPLPMAGSSVNARVAYEGTGTFLTAQLETNLSGTHVVVRAYAPDGSVESSFGTTGVVETDLPELTDLRSADAGGVHLYGTVTDPATNRTFGRLVALDAPAGVALQPPLAATARFFPMVPVRVLDTRDGTGGTAGKPGPGATVHLALGNAVSHASPFTAVVLNVTATEASAPGYVSVWPSGTARPIVSNLNLVHAGDTAANLVVVPVGADGGVELFTQSGTHLVADMAGWFGAAATSTAGRFRSTPVPFRVLDTRTGTGAPAVKPGPDATVTVHVTGAGGVPADGVGAVVLNLTGTEATNAGYVTAWPADRPRPRASNLNLTAGDTRANLVMVPVSPSGDVSLYTQSGTHLVADIAGWFTDASAPDEAAGLYVAIPPRRMLDTRFGNDGLGPGSIVSRRIGSTPVVPPGLAGAVVVNVTATEPREAGYVTAWPSGTDLPLASTLNLPGPGWTVPNLAVVRLGSETISLFMQRSTHLVLDVSGWFVADGVAPG